MPHGVCLKAFLIHEGIRKLRMQEMLLLDLDRGLLKPK